VAVCEEMLGKFGLCGVILKCSFVFLKAGIEIAPGLSDIRFMAVAAC